MGKPKQTLPYQDTTLIGSVVRTILSTPIDAAVVVTRSDLKDKLALPEDDRLHIAINDDERSQMLDSIIIGLEQLQKTIRPNDTDGIMVVPSDMPTLTAETLNRCIEKYDQSSKRIVIALYNGKKGHPIIFPNAFQRELHELEEGLRSLIKKFPDEVVMVETADAGVVLDIDTPQQYDQL